MFGVLKGLRSQVFGLFIYGLFTRPPPPHPSKNLSPTEPYRPAAGPGTYTFSWPGPWVLLSLNTATFSGEEVFRGRLELWTKKFSSEAAYLVVEEVRLEEVRVSEVVGFRRSSGAWTGLLGFRFPEPFTT